MTEKEVVMRLTFDPTKAAQGMKQVAEATQKAGQAARQTQQQFNAAQVAAEAARRIERANREAAVRSSMAQQDPRRFGPGAGRQIDQMADSSGALRFVRPIFAAGAALHVGSAAMRGATGLAGTDLGTGRSIDAVASSAAEAVPVLGTLVGVIRELGQVSLAAVRAGERHLSAAHAIQLAGLTRSADVMRGGRLRQESLARAAVDAGIAAGGAAAYADSLTPDVLAGYRPRPLPGVADEQTGAARMAADQARFALSDAEAVLAARRGEYANAPEHGVMARSHMDWEWASEQARQGRGMASRATRALQNSPGFWGGAFGRGVGGPGLSAMSPLAGGIAEWWTNQGREADIATGQGWASRHQSEANAAATKFNQAQADLEDKRKATAEAEKDAAKARLDYESKILDVRRNGLSILEREVEAGRSGAQASGMAAPGETAQIRAAVEQGQRYGFHTLTQRQKALVASDPDARDWARQQAEAIGRTDPDRQAIRAALGKQELWVQEESANAMRDSIAQDQAGINAQYAKTIESSAKALRDELVEAIGEAIGKTLANIRGDVQNAVDKQMQDRAVGAQQAGGG